MWHRTRRAVLRMVLFLHFEVPYSRYVFNYYSRSRHSRVCVFVLLVFKNQIRSDQRNKGKKTEEEQF